MKPTIGIWKCPRHGYLAIMLTDEHGDITRLTPTKCCGSWTMTQQWALSPFDLNTLMTFATQAEQAAPTTEGGSPQ